MFSPANAISAATHLEFTLLLRTHRQQSQSTENKFHFAHEEMTAQNFSEQQKVCYASEKIRGSSACHVVGGDFLLRVEKNTLRKNQTVCCNHTQQLRLPQMLPTRNEAVNLDHCHLHTVQNPYTVINEVT